MDFTPSYNYHIDVLKVYDGDTITNATIWRDIGFKERHTWFERKIRLYGINCKEMRGKKRTEEDKRLAKEAKELLIFFTMSDVGQEIVFQSHKDSSGTFKRWLGTIYVKFPQQSKNSIYTATLKNDNTYIITPNKWINFNEYLIEHDLAVEYMKK